jgi:hypothetical protein
MECTADDSLYDLVGLARLLIQPANVFVVA